MYICRSRCISLALVVYVHSNSYIIHCIHLTLALALALRPVTHLFTHSLHSFTALCTHSQAVADATPSCSHSLTHFCRCYVGYHYHDLLPAAQTVICLHSCLYLGISTISTRCLRMEKLFEVFQYIFLYILFMVFSMKLSFSLLIKFYFL